MTNFADNPDDWVLRTGDGRVYQLGRAADGTIIMAEEILPPKPIKIRFATNPHLFMFGDPQFIGRHFVLEDFVIHQTLGPAIGHIGGLARADFS